MPQDPKYGLIKVENTPGEKLADDEPAFLILARDETALDTIDAYARIAEAAGAPPSLLSDVMNARARFVEWRDRHPGKVDLPD